MLDRARRILRNRIMLTSAYIGKPVNLVIQGNGNMLTKRAAMIYNTNATTLERATVARDAVQTATFMAAIADLDEAGVQQHVNDILNNSQVSFTVPVSGSAETFQNRQSVVALVEEYDRKDLDGKVIGRGIGLNNVIPAKAEVLQSAAGFFSFDDEAAAIADAPVADAAQGDAFSDAALNEPAATTGA